MPKQRSRWSSLTPVAALILISGIARAQTSGNTKPVSGTELMDEPGEQQRLNREIWEVTRGTSYDQALRHIAATASVPVAGSGTAELPTGWKIGPAGAQIAVGTFPFAATFYGGKVVTVNSGYSDGTQSVSVVDPATGGAIATLPFQNLFPSVTPALDGSLLISGGQSATVYRYDSQLRQVHNYALPGYAAGVAPVDNTRFAALYSERPAGIGISRPGHLVIVDGTTGNIGGDAALGPYEAYSVSHLGGKLYVTIPASNRVLAYDSALNPVAAIAVGAAPLNACSYGPYLYVVNSNSDSISVISSATDKVVATFNLRFDNTTLPFGAAPASCAADADTVYVTFAQANAVGLYNRTTGERRGYIPAGWYPTSVITNDKLLVYVSAKGIRPRRPNPDGTYVLTLLQGSAGVIPKADIAARLQAWTQWAIMGAPGPSQPPPNPGVQHVFFIVKENRTYDQVLGDLSPGNGDPSLVLFGNDVTPIQHYLAKRFITFDNFFVDGEVSTVGHSYTSSGYASPYFQMLTSLESSGRLAGTSAAMPGALSPVYLWDRMLGNNVKYRVFGELMYFSSIYQALVQQLGASNPVFARMHPPAGTVERGSKVWLPLASLFSRYANRFKDATSLAALIRDPAFGRPFSEFFTGDDSLYHALLVNPNALARLVQLLLHYDPKYHPFDLNYSDIDRIATWIPDFQRKDAAGTVETFQYLVLPNDHTAGDSPGQRTPAQYVAQNDAALDLFMRTLAQSRIWANSIVFVVEDDAQNGPDHVDATRTTAFVAGPSILEGKVISDRYDQNSMVRSIEWLTGITPMNLNDALAIPMVSVFSTGTPDPGYNPPAVSAQLTSEDATRYQEVLSMIQPGARPPAAR